MRTVLEINDLNFFYDKFQALKGLSFSVGEGDCVGLVGPNGAGKTTLIRCIMGFFKPYDGTITVYNQNPYEQRSDIMNLIGYLPENAGVYSMSLKDYLVFFALLRGIPAPYEQAEIVAKLFGLHNVLKKNVIQFSQGMKQRAKLASLMLHNPEMLILDDPSAALDISAKEDLIFLLGELKKTNRTLIISSHDPYIMENVCERMILIIEGQKAYDGLYDLTKWQALCKKYISETDMTLLNLGRKGKSNR